MIVIQVAGRLGRDPETRFTASGQKVTSFSLATTIRRGGKEETVWWRITLWGERFDKLMPYLKKGSAVIVTGEMSRPPEIYTDKEGKSQVSLELTAEILKFSPFGNPDRAGQESAQGNAASPTQQSQNSADYSASGFAPYAGTPAGHAASNQDDNMPF